MSRIVNQWTQLMEITKLHINDYLTMDELLMDYFYWLLYCKLKLLPN